jgi:hypothetical protein
MSSLYGDLSAWHKRVCITQDARHLYTASVAAMVVASLYAFLGCSDRAEKYRIAGARYKALGREIEISLLSMESLSDELVNRLREKLDDLAIESPGYEMDELRPKVRLPVGRAIRATHRWL